MLREIPRDDSENAIIHISKLIRDLLRLSPQMNHAQKIPNQGVELFVSKFALNPANLSAGKLLTVFMQIPSSVSPSLLKRLMDSPPYDLSRMNFTFRLKNVCTVPLEIEHHLNTVPIRKIKQTGVYAETDRWKSTPVYGILDPGDATNLGCHYASLNLHRYNRDSREPIYWDGCGIRTVLEEIGYSFDYNGQRVQSWDKSSWPGYTGDDNDTKPSMKVVKNKR